MEKSSLSSWHDDALGPLSLSVVNAHLQLAKAALKPDGVSPVQWAILWRIYVGQATTAAELQEHIPIDMAAVARHVRLLEAMGYLTRRRDRPGPRSRLSLSLTEQGEAIMPGLIAKVQEIHELMLAGVSEEDLAAFRRVVRQVRANVWG